MTTAVKRANARAPSPPTRQPAATRTRPARAQKKTGAGVPARRQTSARTSAGDVAVAAPERPEPRYPVAHALLAAQKAVLRNSVQVRLPLVGELRLPAAEELVYVGGVAALAVIGVVEWPIALLLGIGHTLATNRRNKVVRAFGEAMAEA